jgi:hypothetical protein
MTADRLRRRVDQLEAETSHRGRMTVTGTGDREEIWWTAGGRPPVRIKTLRGVSMEDL